MSHAEDLSLGTGELLGIDIRAVTKSFGSTRVLKGIDLEIEAGELVVLLGPSGCGKSTLLRIISGLERQTSGDIWIGDRLVNDLLPKERDVAMVFQSYALYPHLRVEDNMSFSLRLSRMAPDQIKERLTRAADILGLGGLMKRLPRELSGGQRQRVSMGRAIVRSPNVFLFDEPLSNLDAQLRVHMRGEIRDLHDRLETTSIYVTHDQIEAMTMADRIVIMNNGVIEQIGPPLEVFDMPQTRFVAGFIGSPAMNFFDVRVDLDGDRPVARLSDGSALPLLPDAARHTGRNVTLGIRPHELHLSEDGPLAATPRVVQPTGVETLLIADVAGSEILIQSAERLNPTKGTPIRITASATAVHLFDAETSIRLT